MKIYTKTGDDGSTGLFGGQRVSKASARVDAYGTVDELNSVLGLARVACAQTPAASLDPLLCSIQSALFTLGADLATPLPAPDAKDRALIDRMQPDDVTPLEAAIDAHEATLEPLRAFILPGGTPLAAWLHLARTTCRRAERLCVSLSADEDIGPVIVQYLNRLSDLLFVLARAANHLHGVPDVPWQPVRRAPAPLT
jgi:cob(I)alamin adenosyltransferase